MSTIFKDKVAVQVPLGVLTFNDAAGLPYWYPGTRTMNVDLLEGWQKTVDLNVISVPRGVGDGNYTAPKFPALARNLTIGGYVEGPNRATLDAIWDQMMGDAFPPDVDIVLTRFEPVPKYVTCRVAGDFDITQYMPSEAAFRWEGTLLCSDPFKYDANSTLFDVAGIAGISSGGRTYPRVYPLTYTVVGGGEGNQAVVFNLGTAKAPVLIEIFGPVPIGWRIDNSTTGDSMSFDIDLSGSDVLSIDTRTKTALLNGSPVNGLLHGTWMQLARGNNILKLFADYNVFGSFHVTAKSTWR
jgi:Siphovirus-type tail component, C-terminal domain